MSLQRFSIETCPVICPEHHSVHRQPKNLETDGNCETGLDYRLVPREAAISHQHELVCVASWHLVCQHLQFTPILCFCSLLGAQNYRCCAMDERLQLNVECPFANGIPSYQTAPRTPGRSKASEYTGKSNYVKAIRNGTLVWALSVCQEAVAAIGRAVTLEASSRKSPSVISQTAFRAIPIFAAFCISPDSCAAVTLSHPEGN